MENQSSEEEMILSDEEKEIIKKLRQEKVEKTKKQENFSQLEAKFSHAVE